MAFLFREIRNKSWWDKSKEELPWLGQGVLVGDVFKGLGTVDGSLSVYLINEDKSNINRVVAAYACTRNSIQRVDYDLMPTDAVTGAFRMNKIAGNTADDEVNQWHYDITELTTRSLVDFAYLIGDHLVSMTRVREKTVARAVKLGIERGYLDCDRIDPILRSRICNNAI